MYGLAKKILFAMSPEVSHELALDWLGAAQRTGLLKLFYSQPSRPVEVMGLKFPNPVGLAAGLDKNGDYLNALGDLGFGFVEIGTVTPRPQPGNPQPRLFRLTEHNAIINRMGFNNKGVGHLVERVKKRTYQGILGINIGKNKNTPDEQALDDYLICLRAVYPYADYVTINISSPNTPGLRSLQFGESLEKLVVGIKSEQKILAQQHGRYVPIAVKIAPDMTDDEIREVAATLQRHQIDAVIATNTTLSRAGVETSPHANEAGGLSGAPVRDASTHVIRVLREFLGDTMPIIGVGGIMSGADAKAKIEAGANLIQIYSGFIYRGPELIKECVNAL
ncbi:quinone-dependent dihydroorotate dehydrogenase [Saccharophagus sp. K07]|jgi:dihydroorotate dehydrogenase|uniref:quinone-dependent dihydroorotate dehydrogenase n=1 Tax=Saccharophagus sp. K07 TaxID=2283636 RepID=UPI0016520F3E|nr:quinone-dependent dihydroorotate dehydrogenase [Saccharophagus sp. K07]MBC6904811.1 quinone-dependent dihydroorotate dehydrogenase [Saccharophagus sp. K07]